ncbi:MAG: hypothetical protein L0170_04415 [Acidobacteria bacterium]|nr:hypothetical protein [Acidobacteriota bacterium]
MAQYLTGLYQKVLTDQGQRNIAALSSAAAGLGSLAQGIVTRQNFKAVEKMDEQQLSRYYRRLASQQKVQYGKAGVRLEGTPLDVLAEADDLLAEDLYAQKLRYRNLRKQALFSGVAGLTEGLGRASTTLLSKKIP